jgi:hypothetical protein
MRGAQVALLGALAWQFEDLRGRLDEHLEDNNQEILPHVLMADYERWAEAALERAEPRLQEFLDTLEVAYRAGGPDVEELISVSFLEHLPRPGELGSELRELMGPTLRAQLDVIG